MFLQIDAEVRQKLNNVHHSVPSEELRARLGRLAFHMGLDKRPDAMPEVTSVRGFCSQKQAISWLFDGPHRNYLIPLEITQQQQSEGEKLLDNAEQLGFIIQSANKAVRFSTLELEWYFCASYLFTQPFDTIILRAESPCLTWFWHWWMEYDANLIDKLIAAASVLTTEHRQEYAIRILGHLGNPRAVEPLIRLLDQTDFPMQVRGRAAYALAAFGDSRAITPLIELFKEPGSRHYFDLDMQSLGEEAFSALLAALHSEETLVRKRAAVALGRFNDKRAVDPLIETLHDNDQDLRREAIVSLGILGDKRAIEPILGVLNTPRDIVNWWALDAITQLEAKEAIPKLIKGLEFAITQRDDRKDDVVRLLEILDIRGDILEIILSNPESAQLIQALNYVVDDRVIPPLERQLEAAVQSNATEKAEAIIYALGSLGDKQVVPILQKWLDKYPTSAIRALGNIGDDQNINIFLKYLTHPERYVRSESILGLIKLHDEKAVQPLIRLLQQDSDSWIRAFTAGALAHFSSPLVIPALHSALKDADAYVRILTINALNKLRDLTALPLLEALHQTDTERLPSGEAVWVIAELAIRNLQGDPGTARPLMRW